MYNKRQDWILDFIKDHPKTNRENIEQFLEKMGEKVSKMTINRDLKLLLQDEVITKSGKAKATVYSPSVHTDLLKELNVEDYFAEDDESEKQGFEDYRNQVKGEGKHYDTPLTIEHEIDILKQAGFENVNTYITDDYRIIIATK